MATRKGRADDWLVVINDSDEALAIYGSNLGEEARAKTKELLEQFKFGVRLVLVHMVRPSLHQVIPGKKVAMEVRIYLEGQDEKSEVHPNSLGLLREKGGTWAAYRNEAFDSPAFGRIKLLKFGEGCTYLEAPRPRLPDSQSTINWAYQYVGVVDLITGLIEKAD